MNWIELAFDKNGAISFQDFCTKSESVGFVHAFTEDIYSQFVDAVMAHKTDSNTYLDAYVLKNAEHNPATPSRDIGPIPPKRMSRCCGNDPPTKKMLDLLKSGGMAAAKWALSGFPVVTQDEQNKRLDICDECDHLYTEAARCNLCGCYVKVKAWMSTEHCPQEKW